MKNFHGSDNGPENRREEEIIKRAIQEEMQSLEKQPDPESWKFVCSRLNSKQNSSTPPAESAPEEDRKRKLIAGRRWWQMASAAAAVLLLVAAGLYYGINMPGVDYASDEEAPAEDTGIAILEEEEFTDDYQYYDSEEDRMAEVDEPVPEDEDSAPTIMGEEEPDSEVSEAEEPVEEETVEEEQEQQEEQEERDGRWEEVAQLEYIEEPEYGAKVPASLGKYVYRETMPFSVPERLYLLYETEEQEELIYVKSLEVVPDARLPYLIEDDWTEKEVMPEEITFNPVNDDARLYVDKKGSPMLVWETESETRALWAYSDRMEEGQLEELRRELGSDQKEE